MPYPKKTRMYTRKKRKTGKHVSKPVASLQRAVKKLQVSQDMRMSFYTAGITSSGAIVTTVLEQPSVTQGVLEDERQGDSITLKSWQVRIDYQQLLKTELAIQNCFCRILVVYDTTPTVAVTTAELYRDTAQPQISYLNEDQVGKSKRFQILHDYQFRPNYICWYNTTANGEHFHTEKSHYSKFFNIRVGKKMHYANPTDNYPTGGRYRVIITQFGTNLKYNTSAYQKLRYTG